MNYHILSNTFHRIYVTDAGFRVNTVDDDTSRICHSGEKYLLFTTHDHQMHTKSQLQLLIQFLSLHSRVIGRNIGRIALAINVDLLLTNFPIE